MENQKTEQFAPNKKTRLANINIERVLGYILLIPPIYSVLIFIYQSFFDDISTFHHFWNNSWTGAYYEGGFTSALPFYFGLMAIAGAILLSKSKSK